MDKGPIYMFKKFIILNFLILIILPIFSYLFPQFSHKEIFGFLMITGLIFQWGSLWLLRKRPGGEILKEDIDETGEYHNDFQKVGSGETNINVKPIDLSGNPIEHANETLKEDMDRIKKG